MTTSKPIELGRASEETKDIGMKRPDNLNLPHGDFSL